MTQGIIITALGISYYTKCFKWGCKIYQDWG